MSTATMTAPADKKSHSLALKAGPLLVGLHVAIGLLTLVWLPYDPTAMAGGRLEGPSLLHWFGTDRLGRDLFTQMMIGSRIALIVGVGAVAIGAVIGVTLGLLAAFASKWLDDALAATLDIIIAFPTLLIAMLVVAASDTANLWSAIVALGIALGVAYGEGFRAFTRTGALRAGAAWGMAMSVLAAPLLLPFGAQIVTLNSMGAAFALVARWFVLLVAYGLVLAWVDGRPPRTAARARR